MGRHLFSWAQLESVCFAGLTRRLLLPASARLPQPRRRPRAALGAPRRLMSYLRRAPRLIRGLSSSSAAEAEGNTLPPPRPSAGRRVVVTGLGAVTPLARGVGATWDRLVAGRCAVRSLAAEDLRLPEEAAGRTLEQLPSRVVAAVPRGKGEDEFDEDAWTKV